MFLVNMMKKDFSYHVWNSFYIFYAIINIFGILFIYFFLDVGKNLIIKAHN